MVTLSLHLVKLFLTILTFPLYVSLINIGGHDRQIIPNPWKAVFLMPNVNKYAIDLL